MAEKRLLDWLEDYVVDMVEMDIRGYGWMHFDVVWMGI